VAGAQGSVRPQGGDDAAKVSGGERAGARVGFQGLTLSQVDEETLQELPEEERRVIMATLPRSRSVFVSKGISERPSCTPRPRTLVHGLLV
jgi:hypothetical protein